MIRRITLAFAAISLAALSAAHAGSGELALKSLKAEPEGGSKYGPYVGVFGGASQAQRANMSVDYIGRSLDYDAALRDNNFLMGFEVGYSWKTRRYIELGLEFEGLFSSSQVDALINDESAQGQPVSLNDVFAATADLNFAAFLLNGTIALDLRRLKPRIGPVLPRFRPYVGGGVGGAQVWYRNQRIVSVGDTFGTPTGSSVTPFSLDEFVFAYQFFGGIEYQLSQKISLYGEYRWMNFDKLDVLTDVRTEYLLGGLRIRY